MIVRVRGYRESGYSNVYESDVACRSGLVCEFVVGAHILQAAQESSGLREQAAAQVVSGIAGHARMNLTAAGYRAVTGQLQVRICVRLGSLF